MQVGGAAIIVSILVQIAKSRIPADWVPIAALLMGIALVEAATVALGLSGGNLTPIALFDGALTGIIAGASSIGLYEVQRPTGVLPSRKDPEA